MGLSPWRGAIAPSCWSIEWVCRSGSGCRSPSWLRRCSAAIGTHALRACLRPAASRSGAVHDRSGVHVGRGDRLRHGLLSAVHTDPRSAARAVQCFRHRHGQIPPAYHRDLRRAHVGAAAHPQQDAVRQPPARGGRRPAGGAGARHQCRRCVRTHLLIRFRAGGPGQCAGRGNSRTQTDIPAQIHDLFSDRGDGRRHVEHHRTVPGLHTARRRRRCRQVLRTHAGHLCHLCHHDRRSDPAAAGSVRPLGIAVIAMTQVTADVASYLKRRARWSPLEITFWVFAFASIWLFPQKHLILTETAILALFALSLDLILGYAGIISLGQAAFFGLAGYFSGLVAKYGIINDPVLALICSGLVAALLGFVTSFLVLRGSDLTRLMVTLGVSLMLGEVANRYSS